MHDFIIFCYKYSLNNLIIPINTYRLGSLSINNVKKLSIFFENSAEASSEIVEVISFEPTTCTPPTSLVSPATEHSQFPPLSAARSIIIDPVSLI